MVKVRVRVRVRVRIKSNFPLLFTERRDSRVVKAVGLHPRHLGFDPWGRHITYTLARETSGYGGS